MQNIETDKLLLAKIMDKFKISKCKNKIVNSNFMNEYEISIVKNELKKGKEKNYIIFGGYEGAKREIIIVYPDKINEDIVKSNLNSILKAIKIELPSEIFGTFQHKDYLGTIMSFGLARERIGDILVYEDSAYIITLEENAQYIKESLELERRLKKAKITIINLENIKIKKEDFEEIHISVSSNRLDNIISEILNTSRRISQDLIENEKVFINYAIEIKSTRAVRETDIITIRGKGKYIIEKFLGENKKNKEVFCVKKYK